MGSGVPHGSGNRHHSPADELPGVPIPSDFERLEPGAGGEIEALSNERAADLARCTGGVGVARNPTGCTERRRWSFPREGRDECGKREEEQQRGCPAPTQGTDVVGSPEGQPCLPEGVSGYHGGGPAPPQARGSASQAVLMLRRGAPEAPESWAGPDAWRRRPWGTSGASPAPGREAPGEGAGGYRGSPHKAAA